MAGISISYIVIILDHHRFQYCHIIFDGDDDDNDDGGGVGWHNLKHLFVTGRPYLVSLLLSRSSLRLHITRLNI